MPTVDEIRARAMRHEADVNRGTAFFTVADLAARWTCSATTVRAIPVDALPYINVGQGLTKVIRRYRLADVEAYEERRLAKAG
ncbi:MAG: hypothetical protein JWL61_4053 [Gemmatimonadetes bacterium]|nr:hypothetical protein [Gemmatimonadota bacterium]